MESERDVMTQSGEGQNFITIYSEFRETLGSRMEGNNIQGDNAKE